MFVFYFFIITISAPILDGIYLGIDCIRYIIPAIFLVIFNTGLLFEYFFMNSKKRILYLSVISVSLILIFCSFIYSNYSKYNPFTSFAKIQSYYPPNIKATDEFSKKYKVKNGLGQYWDARFTTIFSKQKVTVNLLVAPFRAVKFANNPHDYYYSDYTEKNPVVYNFIVLRCLEDTAAVYKVFGKKVIKKITIEGNDFYLLPDFILNKDFSSFALVDTIRTN